jgi:hypothetical protein
VFFLNKWQIVRFLFALYGSILDKLHYLWKNVLFSFRLFGLLVDSAVDLLVFVNDVKKGAVGLIFKNFELILRRFMLFVH